MPILTVRHLTIYRYCRPVAFGEHRMMLRPRDDGDQTVLSAEIEITPEPSQIEWALDRFGNHVATARFGKRAAELCFASTVSVDHAPAACARAAVADYARIYPFAYSPADRSDLAPFLATRPSPPPSGEMARWAKGFLRADGSAGTVDLLVEMNRTIHETFRYVARHEKGTQEPGATLALGSGCCRDLAMLMIAALRRLGIAARFVSGYLNLDLDDEPLSGGNTHAWVQVYLPGAGWVDFDPSRGAVGSEDLVRVAVGPDPGEAIPLQGTWIGSASDHLAMSVAVRVRAAAP